MRKTIFWLHLITGVLAGLVILIMSVTGVLLMYQKQRKTRQITLPAWTDHRSQQAGLRRIGDVINTEAIEISLEQVIALECEIRVAKSQLSNNQLYRLGDFRGVTTAHAK